MNKWYKLLSAILVVMFAVSCMVYVSAAEQASETVNTTAAAVETTVEDEPEDTTHAQTVSTTHAQTAATAATAKTQATQREQTQGGHVITDSDSYNGYTQDYDSDSYSKTTKEIKKTHTTKPTTVAKNIQDYGRKYKVAKWIALIFMILSAAALILVNVRHRMNMPESEKRKKSAKRTKRPTRRK